MAADQLRAAALAMTIPTAGRPCLAATLQTLCDSPPDELVLVTDPEGLTGVADAIGTAEYQGHLRIVLESFRSVAHAWNIGYASTTCEHVALCNDDILFPRGWCVRARALIERHGSARFAAWSAFDPLSRLSNRYMPRWSEHGLLTGESWAELDAHAARACAARPMPGALSGYAFIVRRDAWSRIHGADERYAPGVWEDVDLSAKLHWCGYEIAGFGELLIWHGTSREWTMPPALATGWQRASCSLGGWLKRDDPWWADAVRVEQATANSGNREIFRRKWAGTYFEGWGTQHGIGCATCRRAGALDDQGAPMVDRCEPEYLRSKLRNKELREAWARHPDPITRELHVIAELQRRAKKETRSSTETSPP